jgi:rubredoxin
MATNSDMFDEFLSQRGHATETPGWEQEYNKKQCPECSGLHDMSATECTVCGWAP